MSGSAFLPNFNSYAPLGLDSQWLGSANSFGYLLIEQADTFKNGRFKLTTATIGTTSGFTVYSSELATPDATKATNSGELKTGDKIYYYNHDNTHVLIGTVDTVLDGYYDDLKINFASQVSNANVLALGQALQYGAGSLGSREFTVELYDTNNVLLDNTAVPASANPIVLNNTGNGFNLEFNRLPFTENSNAIFAAASSDTVIAYSAKDSLENGAGNYNGTFLEISIASDSTSYMAAAGDLDNLESMSPEFFNALNKIFGLMFADGNGQKLAIDATGKSFIYDETTQKLKIGTDEFATVSFGDMGNNPIEIHFNSNLATTALVKEVLQSITYQNTQDAPFPLSVIAWNLKEQTGVDANNNPTINTLTSGQSLITVTPSNDAPLLRPDLKPLSFTDRFDFSTQTSGEAATQTDVYSSTNTKVVSNVLSPPDDAFAMFFDFLSDGAGVMIGENGASTFTFNAPQTSVSLNFFNGIKALSSLSTEDVTALGDAAMGLIMMGLPHRKVSFYSSDNELLGVSEVTDVEAPSLSVIMPLIGIMAASENPDLLSILLSNLPNWDKFYNAHFTAPLGKTITSVKIEGVATTLPDLISDGAMPSFPVLLDSIIFGEVTTPSLNLPPLTAVQATEFIVGDMVPTGTIVDPDIYPWDSDTTPKAIAISTIDNSQGTWEYKIENGDWTAFDFANNIGKALLLTENDSLQFTPNQNFNGILNNAIMFYGWDKTTGNAGDYLTISGNTDGDKTLSVNSVSASAMTPQAPTLSTIDGFQATDGDVQIVTFSQLLSASNAADVDGTVTAFVVKEVTNGTLKIGSDALTAADFDATTNNSITAVKKAFWTPQGSSNAFTVVAKDNDGTESDTPVAVRINSGILVTTSLNIDDDATIGLDLASDVADGGGLSLHEALNWAEENSTIGFATGLETITLASNADVKAGVTFDADADAVGTLTIEGGTLNLLGALNITNGTNDNLTISSNLTTGDGSLVKRGIGNLTLAGTNSGENAFDGIITIAGGSLTISNDTNLGNGYVQIGTTGATVNEETRSILKITGTGEQDFDNVIMVGASEGEVWIDENLIVTLNGKLDEPNLVDDENGHDLIKTGGGTLILANVGQYEDGELVPGTTNEDGLSGDIFVDEGDVQVASDDALPAGEIYLAEGKEMEFEGDAETALNNPINLNGDANFNVASENKVVTISGEIKGGEGKDFTKKGNGTVNLTGDSTFAGETKVDSGTFLINGSMANTASVTVGGTLGGSGTIGTEGSKGAVMVSSTGTLAPGNSPGQITLKNGLTLSAGAKLSIQLKHGTIDTNANPKVYGYDQVIVKGAVNITGSNLVLGLENNYSFNDGTVFKIIDNDAADAVTGTFSGLSNGSTVTVNGKYFTINYAGGDGNDVTLTSFTPAPEPTPAPTPTPVPTPTPIPTPAPIFEKPVSKDIESQVPSASGVKGDGNGDGISDVNQKNVISLPTQKDLRETIDTPKVFLSIELPQGQTLTKADVKPVSSVTKEGEQITFKTETIDKKGNTVVVDTPITQETAPFGLFEFNFSGVKSTFDSTTGAIKGGTTDVKLYLDDKQTVEKYLKQTVSGTWEAIPFTYVYDEKLGKTVVAFSLTDGDKFDLDGKIDGGISDPGTPIITPKLTIAPVPAPVVELSSPIEKVFVGYGSEFELASGAAQVFGSSMREVLMLKSGASNVVVDQNVEQVNLVGKFADFTFEQQGNSLKVINNSITVAKITVQDDSNGTLLGFTDGLRAASVNNAKISVIDKIVAADDVPLAILQKAGIYLAGVTSNPLTVGSNSISVYGSQASDKVGLSAFATTATIDANVEQVNFAGKFADYSFIPVGNSLNVLSGTTKIANIVIQDDSNGTTLNFSDQSYSAHFVTSATTLQIEITGISSIV